MANRHIACARQVSIEISYKGVKVGDSRLGLLVENVLIVERKAVDSLLPIHKAQVLSYLKALSQPLGLLINFKVEVLRQGIQRVILSK